MKGILKFEKKLARVEGWLLGASLILMLAFAVYGIAYRNAVVPFISYLQTSDAAPPAGEDEYASDFDAPAPAPGAAAAAKGEATSEARAKGEGEGEDKAKAQAAPGSDADEPESDFDSDFDDAPAEKKVAAADDEPESDFDSDFDDAPADKRAAPADDEPDSDFDSDFGGGDDDAKPAAAATAAAAKPPPPPPVLKEDSGLVKFLLWFNFDWLDIVLRHLILWVAFLGGALATQRRKHIAIDALARQMPRRWRPPIAFLVAVVSLVVCGFLASAAYDFTMLEASHGRPLFGSVPGWMGPVIIPIGFGLIGVHYCFRVLEAGLALAGRHDLPDDILEVTLQ